MRVTVPLGNKKEYAADRNEHDCTLYGANQEKSTIQEDSTYPQTDDELYHIIFQEIAAIDLPNIDYKLITDKVMKRFAMYSKYRLTAMLRKLLEEGPKHIDPSVYTVQPIKGSPSKHMTTGFNNSNTQWCSLINHELGEIEKR